MDSTEHFLIVCAGLKTDIETAFINGKTLVNLLSQMHKV
jgi:hypothetical protein